MASRVLRALLALIGLVALFFGAWGIVGGPGQIPGADHLSPNLDNELRFFAAWYAVAGLLFLRVATRLSTETLLLRVLCLGFFAGACGRLFSWISVGRPHWSQIMLMAVEFALPLILLPWHAAVLRRPESDGQTGSMNASSA